MFDDDVEFTPSSDTMDAAAISDIVINGHGKRARPLRNEPDTTAQVDELGTVAAENILLTESYASAHANPIDRIDQPVETFEQRGFAAARRADDAGDFVFGNLQADIFENLLIPDRQIEMSYFKPCTGIGMSELDVGSKCFVLVQQVVHIRFYDGESYVALKEFG